MKVSRVATQQPMQLLHPWLACIFLLCFGVLCCALPVAAQTMPDVFSWQRHTVPEHQLSLMTPADWIRKTEFSEGSPDIFSVHVTNVPVERSAGCGILAFVLGEDRDIDGYIAAMTEERLVRLLSRQYTKVYLHDREVIYLSDRKSLFSVVSGNRKAGRWTLMNFDVGERGTFYRLQCFFRPQEVERYYLTFFTVAQSLRIGSRQ